MTVSRMTEKQVTKAYHDGKITLKQYQDRLREIGTKRHATELKRDPMKRYRATGVLPGSRPKKPKKIQYRRIDLRTPAGFKQAERLKEQGWKVGSVGFNTIELYKK